tara:strand:+ start:2372 stop:2566 length:195 start_codon:yes stop_codon:yes gene_type:complete
MVLGDEGGGSSAAGEGIAFALAKWQKEVSPSARYVTWKLDELLEASWPSYDVKATMHISTSKAN